MRACPKAALACLTCRELLRTERADASTQPPFGSAVTFLPRHKQWTEAGQASRSRFSSACSLCPLRLSSCNAAAECCLQFVSVPLMLDGRMRLVPERVEHGVERVQHMQLRRRARAHATSVTASATRVCRARHVRQRSSLRFNLRFQSRLLLPLAARRRLALADSR